MKIAVVTGSRADGGLLLWPLKLLREDGDFQVLETRLTGATAWEAGGHLTRFWEVNHPDMVLLLGDRFEIMAAALAAWLLRIPIAHIAGGDRTEGSYDEAMRNCISRLATLHFVTNEQALARLTVQGYANVHLVGSPGIDYIQHGDWLKGRPYQEPYVVVSYQAETIDGTNDIEQVIARLPQKTKVWMLPNRDRGNDAIRERIQQFKQFDTFYFESLPHGEFLNLLAHCDEFIGNSSAIFYEAPALNVPTRLVGKRQRGRVQPWGDGHASERIVAILKSFDRASGVT